MARGDLIVKVADKATLDKIYNYLMDENPVYGFIEDMDVKGPSARVEYIGANKDYTPLSLNKSTGVMSLNSWRSFPVIEANKPYMVKSDGTPDYMLDENDYTLKSDGTASDVANTEYDGGAFSWITKIYKKSYMAGNKRVVMYCMRPREGFEPVGFKDTDDRELEGIWLPMFYGSMVGSKMVSLSGLQPAHSQTTAEQKAAMDAFSDRAAFLGGPIVEVITDLLIMFAGTTDIQEAYGLGNCNGYNSSLAPTYGVKENAVIGGGQFYGTSDGKSLNKIFHSIVLGSYQQYMRDPYELVVNGRVKVSKNYTYDLTGASYEDTGINVPNGPGRWEYPLRYQEVDGYGSIPAIVFDGGSTATASCDGLYRHTSQETMTAVARRFGDCGGGRLCGPRARCWNGTAGGAHWDVGDAVLLKPPVGVAA